MKLVVKANIIPENDNVMSKPLLTAITFDKNKKRNQIIYYKKTESLEINKEISISKDYPYIGFILAKYYKVDRKWYQYPLFIIDTSMFNTDDNYFVNITQESLNRVPFGKKWKRSLQYIDFIDALEPIGEIKYLTNDELDRIITEDNDYIILDVETKTVF